MQQVSIMAENHILIIHTGDLPSLTATVLQPEPSQLVLWYPGRSAEQRSRRWIATEALGRMLDVKQVISTESPKLGLSDLEVPSELAQSHTLLESLVLAQQLSCSKIIWPLQVGPDFPALGVAVDRANTMAALIDGGALFAVSGGSQTAAPIIDLPVVDLTDPQLVEILADCGGPLGMFWPCQTDQDEPCGTCLNCRRWHNAYEAAGVDWPWQTAVSTA